MPNRGLLREYEPLCGPSFQALPESVHQDTGAEEQRHGSTERQQVPDEAVSVPGEVILAVDHVVVAAVEDDLVQEEWCRYQAVDNLQAGKIFGMTLQHLSEDFSLSLNCSPFQRMSMCFPISILNF